MTSHTGVGVCKEKGGNDVRTMTSNEGEWARDADNDRLQGEDITLLLYSQSTATKGDGHAPSTSRINPRHPSLTWSKLASPRFPLRSGRFWGGERTRSAEIHVLDKRKREKNGIHIPLTTHAWRLVFPAPVYPPFNHLPVQHFSRRTFFPPQSWPGLGTRPGQTSDAARTPLGDLFTPSSCALVCLPRWRRMTSWVSFPAVHWPGTRRWATKVSVFPRAPHRVYTACGFSF
jgi:hypothetical protein